MKSIVNRVVILLVIGTLTSVLALGKTIEKEVTFSDALNVNGTIVKKGVYKVTFNEETGELTIKKGRKVVATAQGRLEKTNERYNFYTSLPSADPTSAPALASVSLKDGNLVKILSGADSRATSARQ